MLAYAAPNLIARHWPSEHVAPAAHQPYGHDDDYWASLPRTAPEELIVDQPLVGFLIGGALSAVLWGVIAAAVWVVVF